MKLLRRVLKVLLDYSGFPSALFLAGATYLSFQLALQPPDKRDVLLWLVGFFSICALALFTSFLQQRSANQQAESSKAENDKHLKLLEQIATTVGAAQTESAVNAAETNQREADRSN